MKLTSILYELNSELENEMEIIYKDKNVFVMIPKTQKTSKLYGKNANWCQKDKRGFDEWSKYGLLIRFLLRGGRKIRFTYFYRNMNNAWGKHYKGTYYWANETGYHVLEGEGDPFNPQPKNPDRIRKIEQDIIEQIQKIPEEAKQKVREFIKEHKFHYDYCYSDKEFQTKKEIDFEVKRHTLHNIIETYYDAIDSIFGMSPKINIRWIYDKNKEVYDIQYVNNLTKNMLKTDSKEFINFEDAKKYLLDLVQIAYDEHTKQFQPK